MHARARDATPPPLDSSVRALGVVSLLNDVSSEATVRTLPLFLANVLAVPTATIGLIEGIGESTATLLRLGSGALADRMRRKPLVVAGFALSAFTKPLLFFATAWPWVLGVRVADRIGKAVRSPARDALIADLTPATARGRAFGFNKAMDKAGSLIGLLLAAAVIGLVQSGAGQLTRQAFQMVTLLAVLPGIAAVIVLVRAVHEPPPAGAASSTAGSIHAASDARGSGVARGGLGRAFWIYIAILAVFSLGNSSDAFLTLRAQSVGFPAFAVFLVVAGFSAVVAVTSTAAGAWSDRFGRRTIIAAGWAVYAAIYFGFAIASRPWHVAALYAGYGLYYGAFHSAATALVADIVPRERRGAAYGFFHAAVGVTALPASWLAGWLWQRFGAPAPFWFGGGLALAASLALAFVPLPKRAVGSADSRM